MKKKILIKIAIPVVTIAIAAIICVFSFNNKSDNEYSKTDNKKDNYNHKADAGFWNPVSALLILYKDLEKFIYYGSVVF